MFNFRLYRHTALLAKRWCREVIKRSYCSSPSLDKLSKTVTDLITGYSEYEAHFSPLVLKPGSPELNHKNWEVESGPDVSFLFSQLFTRFFGELITFEETGELSPKMQTALTTLISYLEKKEKHEKVLRQLDCNVHPSDQISILVNHVLARLVDRGQHVIISPAGKHGEVCPCKDESCTEEANLGWLSSYKAYEGADVLLFQDESVLGCLLPRQNVIKNDSTDSDLHPASDLIRNFSCQRRGISFMIKYAFYQFKIHSAQRRIREVRQKNQQEFYPVIALTAKYFDIFVYNVADDILLQTKKPIALWKGDKLNPIALMQLWFVLNYQSAVIRLELDKQQRAALKFGFHDFIGKGAVGNFANSIELIKDPFYLEATQWKYL